MNTATQSFGRRLRSQRERLGISLEAIARSTRIHRPLLADLERGDTSKWPGGIYRRAFLREYAAAIGLPVEEVVAEFLELFPEEGTSPSVRLPTHEPPTDLRLTLAEDRTQALVASARRLLVAALELCGVLGLGWLLAWLTAAPFWTIAGMTALVYYPLTAACSTRSLAFRRPALGTLFSGASRGYAVPSARDLIRLVLHQTPAREADERTA
jgi:transcriptional regulator with XRE-family HTH domain